MSLDTIYDAVLDGNIVDTKFEVQDALEAGLSAESILNEACIPAMTEVGRLFEIGESFVPEMMSAATEILKPRLAAEGVAQIGTVVVGTVAGDLHDIGKNLVIMMLEGAGFKIIDLGVDVSAETFVEAATVEKPDIVAMSALLTTTMKSIPMTIEALDQAGIRDQVKVMIGGAPVTRAYAEQVGADGFSPDAGSVANEANALLSLAV